MTQLSRLQQAALTSSDGTRVEFDWERAPRTTPLRNSIFESAGSSIGYIQKNGTSSKRYPIVAIFTGDDCDLFADQFEAVLVSPGKLKLDHPVHGVVEPVAPLGEIRRENDLVESVGEIRVTVTLAETIETPYDSTSQDYAGIAGVAISASDSVMSGQVGTAVEALSVSEELTFRGRIDRGVKIARAALDSISSTIDGVDKQYNAIVSSINAALDTFVLKPASIAFQVSQLLRAPSNDSERIGDKLDAYTSLLSTYTKDVLVTSAEMSGFQPFASSSVLSAANAARFATYRTKTQALTAADILNAMLQNYVAWLEQSYAAQGVTFTGDEYGDAQDAVAAVTAHLIELSYTLLSERRFTVQAPINPVVLGHQLYGRNLDFDFFAASNNFAADEFILLPIGREVVHYI